LTITDNRLKAIKLAVGKLYGSAVSRHPSNNLFLRIAISDQHMCELFEWDSNMTSSKFVFLSLLLGLTGCLKPQNNSGDRAKEGKHHTSTTGNQTPVNRNGAGDGNGDANENESGNGSGSGVGDSEETPEILTSVSLNLNLLPAGTTMVPPKVFAGSISFVSSSFSRVAAVEVLGTRAAAISYRDRSPNMNLNALL
jgi:hypothetical protein